MTAEGYADLLAQSLLLEEIGQSVIALDRSWRVTYWNRASERLYGYAAGEMRGRKRTELSIIAGPEATRQGNRGHTPVRTDVVWRVLDASP